MGINWADLYGDSPMQVVELDEGGRALIALIPEHKRDEIEPMLRGMLAQMRAQLGGPDYARFCIDMKRGYEYHQAGEFDNARLLFTAWGIPYDALMQADNAPTP